MRYGSDNFLLIGIWGKDMEKRLRWEWIIRIVVGISWGIVSSRYFRGGGYGECYVCWVWDGFENFKMVWVVVYVVLR